MLENREQRSGMDLLALPCVVQAGENAGSNASQYEAEVLFYGIPSRHSSCHLHILRSSLLTGLYVHNHHVIQTHRLHVCLGKKNIEYAKYLTNAFLGLHEQ